MILTLATIATNAMIGTVVGETIVTARRRLDHHQGVPTIDTAGKMTEVTPSVAPPPLATTDTLHQSSSRFAHPALGFHHPTAMCHPRWRHREVRSSLVEVIA